MTDQCTLLAPPGEPSSAQTTPEQRLQIAMWVDRNLEALAAEAADAIFAAIPSYRETGLKDDVARHCAQVFGVFARVVREDREPQAYEFAGTVEHAETRVTSGVSLPDLLQAFRVKQLALWRALVGYFETQDLPHDQLSGLVDQVMLTTEAGSSAAATAYLEAQQFHLADRDRTQRGAVEDLLSGFAPTTTARERVLRDAGLGAGTSVAVLVASTLLDDDDDAPDGQGRRADHMLAEARTVVARFWSGVIVPRGRELVGVVALPAAGASTLVEVARDLKEKLAEHGLCLAVGVSTAHVGLGEVREAYDEAVLARGSLGRGSGVMALSSLTALNYLVQRPDVTARRLVRPEVLGFFAEDAAGDGVYAETLQAFADHHLNARETARALHVHVNTVYYRLERIGERTNSDVRQVDDLVELLIGIRAAH